MREVSFALAPPPLPPVLRILAARREQRIHRRGVRARHREPQRRRLFRAHARGGRAQQRDAATAVVDAATAATAAAVVAEKAKNLPAGWEPHLDEASGTTYYYHAGSDSTSWVFPGSW